MKDSHTEEFPALVELRRPAELLEAEWVEALFDLAGMGAIEVVCVTDHGRCALVRVLKPLSALRREKAA